MRPTPFAFLFYSCISHFLKDFVGCPVSKHVCLAALSGAVFPFVSQSGRLCPLCMLQSARFFCAALVDLLGQHCLPHYPTGNREICLAHNWVLNSLQIAGFPTLTLYYAVAASFQSPTLATQRVESSTSLIMTYKSTCRCMLSLELSLFVVGMAPLSIRFERLQKFVCNPQP